jgi:hypothetical protein
MKIGQFDVRMPKHAPISKSPRSRKIALALVTCMALLIWAKPMGLLLWARIRILTNIPKTAIAEPTAEQASKPTQPNELDPKLPALGAELRDPFSVDSKVFPLPNAVTQQSETTVTEPDAADPGAVVEQAVESPAPSRYETLRASAETVLVSSAGSGLQVAVIDGKVVRVGDTVTASDGTVFTLVGVQEAAVVLGFEGREFVVRMPLRPESKAVKPLPRGGGGKP